MAVLLVASLHIPPSSALLGNPPGILSFLGQSWLFSSFPFFDLFSKKLEVSKAERQSSGATSQCTETSGYGFIPRM